MCTIALTMSCVRNAHPDIFAMHASYCLRVRRKMIYLFVLRKFTFYKNRKKELKRIMARLKSNLFLKYLSKKKSFLVNILTFFLTL